MELLVLLLLVGAGLAVIAAWVRQPSRGVGFAAFLLVPVFYGAHLYGWFILGGVVFGADRSKAVYAVSARNGR